MDLEKNKQRLEIIAAELEELKNSGGGGTVDAYTKAEADNKFAEKATTYTKTEVDEAIASAGGGGGISYQYEGFHYLNTIQPKTASQQNIELSTSFSKTLGISGLRFTSDYLVLTSYDLMPRGEDGCSINCKIYNLGDEPVSNASITFYMIVKS